MHHNSPNVAWWLAHLWLALWAGASQAGPEAVGAVTLKLGEAWIVAADGQRRSAASAASVHVGEVLETAASGHLHIRFTDGGVVAVRPGSRLIIEDYRNPQLGGAIRFRLERGTVRTITGGWSEADRSRFRLNTPIAAIGISGTDFIVQGEADLVRVIVQRGGIVAAPFDATCRPDGLGPCSGERARTLTAAMGGLMLEFRSSDAIPTLIPKKNGLTTSEAVHRPIETAAPKTETIAQTLIEQPLPAPPATLVWGRWAHTSAWPGDALALPRAEAAQGRERIAENSRYVLYRLPQTEPMPTAGMANLSLTAAQAHLVQTTGVLPAQVQGGHLTLDFAARRFDTALTLDSAPTGQVPFTASGPIRPDGSFSLIEWQNRLSGAWGTGGSGPTAAYLFERATPQGMFMGITQWR